MIKIFIITISLSFLIYLSEGVFNLENDFLIFQYIMCVFVYLLTYIFIILSYIENVEMYKILKKIDNSLLKKIYIFMLFKKDQKEIMDSLTIIEKINQKDPEWFIRVLSRKKELKIYLLSKKEFINYLNNFNIDIIQKYFKEELENVKYIADNNQNYLYFKELIRLKKS